MYTLFLDESGKNCLRAIDPTRPHFSFASVIIENGKKNEIKIKADQIKFKYWGYTSIVFHAIDLKGLQGKFYKFRRKNKKLTIADFYIDLLNFLDKTDMKLSFVCLNKLNYIAQNPPVNNALQQVVKNKSWEKMIIGKEKNIVKEQADKIFEMYLYFLKEKNVSGKIVVEATGDPQDLSIFASYNNLLTHGCSNFQMLGADVREHFTSISFVTKKNQDIETQLADLAAYYLNLEARKIDGLEIVKVGSFEEKLINIFKSKTFEYMEQLPGGSIKNSFYKLY